MNAATLNQIHAAARQGVDRLRLVRKYAHARAAYVSGNAIARRKFGPLAESIRWLAAEEEAALKTKGNLTIPFNSLPLISGADFAALPPHLQKWCRTTTREGWVADPCAPAPKKNLRLERWSTAKGADQLPEPARPTGWRALWANAQPLPPDDVAEDGDEDTLDAEDAEDAEDGTPESEEEAFVLKRGAFGEDVYCDPTRRDSYNLDGELLRSVIESDQIFFLRRPADNLDELFGEEPKDPRALLDEFEPHRSPSAPKGLDAFFEEEEPATTHFFPLTKDGRPQDEIRRRRSGDEGDGAGWLAGSRAEARAVPTANLHADAHDFDDARRRADDRR